MNRRWHGSILVLISAVSFGLMPIFARFAYGRDVGVQELLFMRFLLAFLLMGIFLRLAGTVSIPKRKDLLGLLALGGIGYYLQSTFYFTALLYIPVSVAALVLNTYPTFVTAGSLALGWEKASVSVVLSLSLALVGLALVANPIMSAAGFGVLIAFGAAITYTAYILISTRTLKGLTGELGSFYIMGAASLSFGTSSLLTGQLRLAWSLEAWVWVLMISVISTSLAITAFFQGLKLVGPTRTSILSTAELVTSVVAAAVIFNENLTITQLIGGLLIISATISTALS
nr:DMT family transporter [Candidatus Njordarchaeum guaymaensis]